MVRRIGESGAPDCLIRSFRSLFIFRALDRLVLADGGVFTACEGSVFTCYQSTLIRRHPRIHVSSCSNSIITAEHASGRQ